MTGKPTSGLHIKPETDNILIKQCSGNAPVRITAQLDFRNSNHVFFSISRDDCFKLIISLKKLKVFFDNYAPFYSHSSSGLVIHVTP